MFSNKKGAFIDLKNMILILLAFVFIFFIVKTITEGGSRGADIAACRNWAVIESSAKVPLVDIKLTNLNSPCTTFKDELKGNEFEVHETLAKGMYDVWKMYGQGKLDFLSDWSFVFDRKTYCFIGDEIKVDKDREINIDKFEEYLSDNNPTQNEQTYAEFFTGTKGTRLDFGSGNINLKKDENVYILFTAYKGQDLDIGSTILSCGIGGAGVAKVGVNLKLSSLLTKAGAKSLGKASVVGCGIGIIVKLVGKSPDLYPGLILISEKDIPSLKEKCDGGLYYNPKQKIV